MSTQTSRLRLRLLLGTLTPLLLAGLCQTIYTIAHQRAESTSSLASKARALTSLMVSVAGPSIALDDPAAVDEGLGFVTGDPDFGFALARDADGKPIAYRGPETARATWAVQAPLPADPVSRRDADLLIETSPVITNGKRIGAIEIGLNAGNANERGAAAATKATLIALLGIATAIAIVAFLTRQVVRRNRDMRLLLDNVDQGFVTVERDGTLASERSAIAARLFGDAIRGQRASEALAKLDAEVGAWFALGWDMVIADELPLEVTLDQLPRRLDAIGCSYRLDYKPLLAGGALERVLLVITDITDQLARDRAEAAERDLLNVVTRMRRDRRAVADFVDESDRLVAIVTDGLRASADVAIGASLKRDLHTLKGNAGLFGLTGIADLCARLEDAIASGTVRPTDADAIGSSWSAIKVKLDLLLVGFDSRTDVRPEDVQALREAIVRGATLAELRAMIATWSLEPIEAALARLGEQARRLGERLGRDLDVVVEGNGIRVPLQAWRPFLGSLVHAIRNAVEHGIETPEERTGTGKTRTGRLELRGLTRDGKLILEIVDDGRGIDLNKVARSAERAGMTVTTERDLLDAVFADGVTTSDEVTDLSGRGVGMASMRAECQRLGGDVELVTTPGRGTVLRFSWLLTPPLVASAGLHKAAG